MDELTRNFAKNLRGLRLNQKLSQMTLANRTKLSVSYVSMLERGMRSPPLPTICAVAKSLKVRPSYLLQELDLPAGPPDLRGARGRPLRTRR